jgi:hypothetical protein
MPKGMQPIYTQTVPSSASFIAFNNIPQDYTDLLIKLSIRGTWTSFDSVGIIFNDLQNSRSRNIIQGSGTAATSSRGTYRDIGSMGGTNTTSNVYASYDIYIPNYTLSMAHQCVIEGVVENSAAEAYTYLTAFVDFNTLPIKKLNISSSTSGLALGPDSTMSLYGIGRL